MSVAGLIMFEDVGGVGTRARASFRSKDRYLPMMEPHTTHGRGLDVSGASHLEFMNAHWLGVDSPETIVRGARWLGSRFGRPSRLVVVVRG